MNVSAEEKRPVIVGLGEVLWDVFPDGPRFGGAPANYACSVASLSSLSSLSQVDVFMVGGVGADDLGQRAIEEFRTRNVNTSVLQTTEKPTGVVNVAVDPHGVASYEFAANAAWDNLQWTAQLQTLAERTTAVCFGSLGQRSDESRSVMLQFVSTTPAHCLRIFDINLRPPFYTNDIIVESLKLANVLKLNDDELPVVAALSGEDSSSLSEDEVLRKIAERWSLQTIALTRGAEGATLFHDGDLWKCSAVSTSVVDTVGAGDSFTAAMTLGLLAGTKPNRICEHACRVAAYVCSQPGATPAIPSDLRL